MLDGKDVVSNSMLKGEFPELHGTSFVSLLFALGRLGGEDQQGVQYLSQAYWDLRKASTDARELSADRPLKNRQEESRETIEQVEMSIQQMYNDFLAFQLRQ
jgi:hypothetical protein